MCDCDIDVLKDAKHVGRAHWVCPKCKEDVSLLYVLLYEIAHEDTVKQLQQAVNKHSKMRKNHGLAQRRTSSNAV